MNELRPCGECRRHVAIDETACPFCGAAGEATSMASSRLGRVSRAAVFAGAALATAATGCGGKKPKADTINNEGDKQAASADAGTAEPPPPPPDHSNIPMPYGAPPVRRRVV